MQSPIQFFRKYLLGCGEKLRNVQKNSKISKYPSKYGGKLFRESGKLRLKHVRYQLPLSFPVGKRFHR